MKKLLNITNKIQITREANESILRGREFTLRFAHARVMCSECNCTKIMHARYFRVLWVLSIQIGCSMRVVYAECMKALMNFNQMLLCQIANTYGTFQIVSEDKALIVNERFIYLRKWEVITLFKYILQLAL